MKSVPNIDYDKLTGRVATAQEKPTGKYQNIKNYLKERTGVDVDDTTLDKKLRTFFEDLITEVLKNPAGWDKTKNINFMELMNYLAEGEPQPKGPEVQVKNLSEIKDKPWTLHEYPAAKDKGYHFNPQTEKKNEQ